MSACSLKYKDLVKPEFGPFIDCEIAHYGPKSSAYVQKVMAHAQGMGQTLIKNAQTDVSGDLDRVDADVAKVEKYMKGFIQQAMSGVEKELPELKKLAAGLEKQALADLSAWIDKETDNLIHSLAPILAWIVALLLFYQIYGGVFDTMPVAYRLAIATLVVISAPPVWRSKVDMAAAPFALALFYLILYKSKFGHYPFQ